MVRVDGDGTIDWLDTGADTTDDVGVMRRRLSGDAAGSHCSRRHIWLYSHEDNPAAVVQSQDTSDGIGSVIEGWTERSGSRCHMFGFERCVCRSKGIGKHVKCI